MRHRVRSQVYILLSRDTSGRFDFTTRIYRRDAGPDPVTARSDTLLLNPIAKLYGNRNFFSTLRMQSCPSTICTCLLLLVLGSVIVQGEPVPMVRPTRPEVFTSPEELRKYLDHVSDYYSLSGKARYGKRGNGAASSTADDDHVWNTMRTMLENSYRSQRLKFERRLHGANRFLGDLGNGDNRNDDSRPCDTLDTADRYYDDFQ